MRSRRSSLVSSCLHLTAGLLALSGLARATTPAFALTPPSAGNILEELQRFRETGRVLYLAAHPDDENTRLIAYLANGRHYATGYLSLTRGDGGQNLLGPELRDALGVIRTQELLAARRIDGGRQFFSRANDFGYSKSAEEALTVWDRAQVLCDTVRVIRTFRPDVIVTRFSPTQGGTHGHHTASAIMAVEAFALAADPNAFPDQLGDLPPWQPVRVVWNSWQRGGTVDSSLLALDVGGYDTLRGESFGEIAARSRSQHRSQGFGAVGTRGSAMEYFDHLVGTPAKADLFDDVVTRWSHYRGGEAITTLIDAVIAAYDPRDPHDSISSLLSLKAALATLPSDDPFVLEKRAQLDAILVAALGLYAEATVETASIVPGEPLSLNLSTLVRIPTMPSVRWTAVHYLATGETQTIGEALVVDSPITRRTTATLPTTTPLTHPYWLELPSTAGMAVVANEDLIGTPENAPAFAMVYEFTVDGQSLLVPVTPVDVLRDPVRGELRLPLEVIPPVSVAFGGDLELFALGTTKTVRVTATAARAGTAGELKLDLPPGWQATPVTVPFRLAAVGEQVTASFQVTAPARPESVKIGVAAIVDGRTFNRGTQRIAYDHIPAQLLQPPATFTVVSLELAIRGETVGYLPGAGDTTAEALVRMGYTVKTLSDADLTPAGLAGLDAVVLGIRAFNTRPELMAHREALWAYVKQGGNVIVQYNTTAQLPAGELGPYPLHISRDRVTDEGAAVAFLAPQHPAILGPNRLNAADFAGWVQERGLYFPDTWDIAYTPLLGMADPGERQTKGSLLVARHGEGYFVYTGLSFFRELPAGVPGAYRLLANLVSL